MAQISSVLVVGGGIAGLTVSTALQRRGMQVEVVELHPRVAGVGILLSGATLRALDRIGLARACVDQGHGIDVLRVDDAAGRPLTETRLPNLMGAPFPASVGLLRRSMSAILMDAAEGCGVGVRNGITVDVIEQDPDGVNVRLSDGSMGRYDLLVGADGIHSQVRRLVLGRQADAAYVGQGSWRFLTARHPDIDRLHIFQGPKFKAGFIPLGPDLMYMMTTQNFEHAPHMAEDRLHEIYRELLCDFTAPVVREVSERLESPENVIWRNFETVLVPNPWYVGRVVMIGDAVHAMTPHLTSGGGMAIEDGIVLADLLLQEASLPRALERFMACRFERVREVLEVSGQISRLEQQPVPSAAEIYRLTVNGYQALARPFMASELGI